MNYRSCRRGAVHRAGLLFCLLLTGCEPEVSPEERVANAQRLRHEGKLDEAIAEMKRAVQSSPRDGSLRLTLAEIHIELGRGDLAEVLLEQAAERGVAEDLLVVPRVRSLVAQRSYDRVLSAVNAIDSYRPAQQLELLLARGEAELALSDDPDDLAAARTFLAIHRQLAGTGEAERDMAYERVARRVEALRDMPAVARAREHELCSREPAATVAWEPLAGAAAQVLRVGPGLALKTPAAAAGVATDGARVEIEAAQYPGGVAIWPQNDLHVIGVGGRPHVTASGKSVERRDIWLFTGNDVIVENVELSGARSAENRNGAAIRHVGRSITLRHVYLHHSENGLMTGNNQPDSEILIEHSEFQYNGDGEGFAHNLYVGYSRRLMFRYNYSHTAQGGHLLKSRAAQTVVAYSRLSDEEEGTSSYTLDLPNAGHVSILGNVLEQGSGSLNHTIVSYGAEGLRYPDNQLFVLNNTIYNRDMDGIAVENHTKVEARIINTVFAGAPVIRLKGAGSITADLVRADNGLENPRAFLFEPGADSPAVDAGTNPAAEAISLQPSFEYVHPVQYRPRPVVWRVDIGAYERCGL